MNDMSGNGILFIIAAIAVAAAMFLLCFVAVFALADIFGLSTGWADLLVRYFQGTGLGIFALTLGFFVVSVVRCFAVHGETFGTLLWLMFVAGLFYATAFGMFGLPVYLLAKIALEWEMPVWSLWPTGFCLFIGLRLAFSADRATD